MEFLLIENGFATTYERIIHRCHYGFAGKRYRFSAIWVISAENRPYLSASCSKNFR
jgi:hypothetical protein